jgi:AraC family transcriptional regulator
LPTGGEVGYKPTVLRPPATTPALARIEGGVTRAMPDAQKARAVLDRAWRGLRVLRLEEEPRDLPEGALVNHVVFLNLGAETVREARIADQGWAAHRFAHHGVTVFPAGLPHAVRAGPARELLLVEIAPAFADEVLQPCPPAARLGPVLGVEDPFAAHVVLALGEEARSGSPLGEIRAQGLGAALVAHLAAEQPLLEPLAAAAPGLATPRLRRVLEYVARHLDAPLTLRTLSERAEMDLFRFVRAFKESTGVSPHRYVLEARIARAKELLGEAGLSITEIALRTGFATPSHFSVTFRRMTGATPRGFRERLPRR